MNHSFLTVLAALAIFAMGSPADAQEINQRTHLAPAQASKLARVVAAGRRDAAAFASQRNSAQLSQCGSVTIGDFSEQKRPPRDIVIVTGDIINVNRNCGR